MNKPVIYGTIGGFLLIAAFFTALTLLNSFAHALGQFYQLWYWMIPLSAGFGVQIGLFSYVRNYHRTANVMGICTTGGVSGASMAACCTHHIADVLPFIGITGLTFFVNKYQTVFMVIGLFSSIIGILIMLRMISKLSNSELGSKLSRFNFNFAIRVAALTSVMLVALAVGFIAGR